MADKTGTNQPIGTPLSPRQECFVLDCISTTVAITIGRFVTITGIVQSGQAWKAQVAQATAAPTATGAPILGVALQTTGTVATAVAVLTRGLVVCEAGASITVGVGVVSDTSGRAVANAGVATGDNEFLGIGILVLQNGTAAAGDGVGVLVIR